MTRQLTLDFEMNSMLDQFCDGLEAACAEAMEAAKDKPGRYGGRYVCRHADTSMDGGPGFYVHDDDDPDTDESLNVFAHVTPDEVHAVGFARNYLGSDGKVNREFLGE